MSEESESPECGVILISEMSLVSTSSAGGEILMEGMLCGSSSCAADRVEVSAELRSSMGRSMAVSVAVTAQSRSGNEEKSKS